MFLSYDHAGLKASARKHFMDSNPPKSQLEIDDEVRVVIDHRSRRWQLTMFWYLANLLNVSRHDCPNEIAKALKAEQAAKAI